jgi:hypothetical protein
MKKMWSWLLAAMFSVLPSLALANTQVHVSEWVGPFVKIVAVIIVCALMLWGLDYWKAELARTAPMPKILTFAIIIVGCIIILVILLGLVGVSIT